MPPSIENRSPGVHLQEVAIRPAPALETGVPAFAGRLSAAGGRLDPLRGREQEIVPLDYAAWAALDLAAGPAWAEGYLGFAVRGFFENGGRRCHLALHAKDDLEGALTRLEALDDFDVLCAPDAAGASASHVLLLDLCARRPGCFALLDTIGNGLPDPSIDVAALAEGAKRIKELRPAATRVNGALYGPWIRVSGACPKCAGAGCASCQDTGQGFVPASGHVAGVLARLDQRVGVHRAPANEAIEGAVDVAIALDDAALASLNGQGVDCVRALPGRGIRPWGARTLAPDDAGFSHVSLRRTYLTVLRWLDQLATELTFEPNDLRLWLRIHRQVSAFLDGLYRRGALYGASAREAYYVKCDSETNPQRVRDAGQVVAEVGIALARPSEFVVLRLVTTAGTPRAGAA